jgi:hypothetical protein
VTHDPIFGASTAPTNLLLAGADGAVPDDLKLVPGGDVRPADVAFASSGELRMVTDTPGRVADAELVAAAERSRTGATSSHLKLAEMLKVRTPQQG